MKTKEYFLISVQPFFNQNNSWSLLKSKLESFLRKENSLESIPKFIVFPEYFFESNSKSIKAKTDQKELIADLSNFSIKNCVYVVAGSLTIEIENYLVNRSHIFGPKGLISHYDKQKLFNYEKKRNLVPGINSGIIHIKDLDLTIQILICSDLWFPELIRNYNNNHPDMILVPSMSVVPERELVEYGRKLWHNLAFTRSRENVVPVVVSDWAVQSLNNTWISGASSITNPSIKWKNDLDYNISFKTLVKGEDGIISTRINREKILSYRNYRKEVGLLPNL